MLHFTDTSGDDNLQRTKWLGFMYSIEVEDHNTVIFFLVEQAVLGLTETVSSVSIFLFVEGVYSDCICVPIAEDNPYKTVMLEKLPTLQFNCASLWIAKETLSIENISSTVEKWKKHFVNDSSQEKRLGSLRNLW
ncbi:MAG: hypothetical protein AAFY76_07115 [Cyanobacteria bacterium J06649_11]